MTTVIRRISIAAFAATSICLVFAQSSPAAKTNAGKLGQAGPESGAGMGNDDGIPLIHLEFKSQGAIPGVGSSPAILMPILCGPDGTAFVAAPQPPNYMSEVIYSLNQKGGVAFSYQAAPGLYDMHYLGFYPGHSMVGILVNATADPKSSQYTVTSADGQISKGGAGFRGAHHDYILEFDRDGNYKRTVDLPEGFSFHRFAELDDGDLLAVGYDRPNATAKLFLLDSNGRIIRPLQIPEAVQENPELAQGETGGLLNAAKAETSLSWWLFAPVRDRILLYLARSRDPVLEIGPGGASREVAVETPPGYLIDGVIPSSDRWMFRFRRDRPLENSSTDARNTSREYRLYEVNPNDGSLKSEYVAVAGPGFGTACERDSVLSGFSASSDNKYLLLTADIPK